MAYFVLFWGACSVLGGVAVQSLTLLWGSGFTSASVAGCEFGHFLCVVCAVFGAVDEFCLFCVPFSEPWGDW